MVTRQVTNGPVDWRVMGLAGDSTVLGSPPSHLEDHHLSDQFTGISTIGVPMSRASCLLLCATPDTAATTHSALTASFSRLPSSPSLLSLLLRGWTIDLRNEVGLLSRIYTGFSLCVSDRFPPVRHSLSLRIFMLVRTRQRTQEQGEDAPETALPLASSPSPPGRGFLGLTLVGFVGFFPPFIRDRHRRPARIAAALSDPGQGWVIFNHPGWCHQHGATSFAVTLPTMATGGVTCLAARCVAAGGGGTLMGCDSARRQLPARCLPRHRHFFCGQSCAAGVTDTEAIN